MILLRLLIALVCFPCGLAIPCVFIGLDGYSIIYTVDNEIVQFNLTVPNLSPGFYTGIGFGNSTQSGLDVILIGVGKNGQFRVADGLLMGSSMPLLNPNPTVRTLSTFYNGRTLNALFVRPLSSTAIGGKSLSGCVKFNFLTKPGPIGEDGFFGALSEEPVKEEQCDITTRCSGKLASPRVQIDLESSGLKAQIFPGERTMQADEQLLHFLNSPINAINRAPGEKSVISSVNSQQPTPQFFEKSAQPTQVTSNNLPRVNGEQQSFTNTENVFGPFYPFQKKYSSEGFREVTNFQRPPLNNAGNSQSFVEGSSYRPVTFSPSNVDSSFYGPNNNQNFMSPRAGYPYGTNESKLPGNHGMRPYESRRKRAAARIRTRRQEVLRSPYGGAEYGVPAVDPRFQSQFIQNPNYEFLPNFLANYYAKTLVPQRDSTSLANSPAYTAAGLPPSRSDYSGIGFPTYHVAYDKAFAAPGYSPQFAEPGAYPGERSSLPVSYNFQAPVLSNQAQNRANYANIQRDYASGRHLYSNSRTSNVNIYGYDYGKKKKRQVLLRSDAVPLSSSVYRANSLVYEGVPNQLRQRFYNPGFGANGNVFTGSLYKGGDSAVIARPATGPSGILYDTPLISALDPMAGMGGFGGASLVSSTNRGPQPGQVITYPAGIENGRKRKKRQFDPVWSALRGSNPGVSTSPNRFFDPGNNQTAMYLPYRTASDFNLNYGQPSFSQTTYTGGSGARLAPQYSASVVGAASVAAPLVMPLYDSAAGADLTAVPIFDSRGGNQYLRTAPANPQSPNFLPALANNDARLAEYTDLACARPDPYWCASYVQQLREAQGNYANGLCANLISSLQFADNRCCRAVRAAGCPS